MPNVYEFRSGHSIRGVNPQRVGEELDRIRAERGQLTRADVVEEAQPPESPMHPAFEWDDSEAAKQYRLNQAGRLITSVRVINGPVQIPVPAFVSVRTPEKGRSYMPTVEALTDEQIKSRVLMEVRQFVEGLERRYRYFQEAADILARLRQNVG